MHAKTFERPTYLVMCLVAAGSIACGKTSSPAQPPGYTLIDDMEGQDGRIKWIPSAPDRLPGSWSSATDCLQMDRILPEPPNLVGSSGWSYDSVFPSYPTMEGVTSQRAAHLRTKFGQTLSGVWGANVGFDFAEQLGLDAGSAGSATDIGASASRAGPGCRQGSSRDFSGATMDLSEYTGITFWAMAATSGRQVIRVQINDVNTDPRGDFCSADGRTEKDNCYNGFAKDIMLTNELSQYHVDFSELRQDPSWGFRPNPSKLDFNHVYAMNFEVPLPGCTTDTKATCAGPTADVSFDVWIDDLYFVNR